jgi:hypothetical protein
MLRNVFVDEPYEDDLEQESESESADNSEEASGTDENPEPDQPTSSFSAKRLITFTI